MQLTINSQNKNPLLDRTDITGKISFEGKTYPAIYRVSVSYYKDNSIKDAHCDLHVKTGSDSHLYVLDHYIANSKHRGCDSKFDHVTHIALSDSYYLDYPAEELPVKHQVKFNNFLQQGKTFALKQISKKKEK